MKLGVCTWTFGPRPLRDIARAVAELHYDGVELHGDLEAFSPTEARTALDGEGLDLFSLTPANVDPAHPDISTRQTAIDYYRRLVDFAAEAGGALVSVHGYVGRIAAMDSMAAERRRMADAVAQIAAHAEKAGVNLVYEVLNRYESHLINTGADAVAFLAEVGSPRLKVLLDAYHMNIEEAELPRAIFDTGRHLGLFHAADSNRDAIGEGHIDFAAILEALKRCEYSGPIILECTPPGPNPFTPLKGEGSFDVLRRQLETSRNRLRSLFGDDAVVSQPAPRFRRL